MSVPIDQYIEKLGNLAIAGLFAFFLVKEFLNYSRKNSEKSNQQQITNKNTETELLILNELKNIQSTQLRLEAQMVDSWKTNLLYKTFIETQTQVLREMTNQLSRIEMTVEDNNQKIKSI